MTVKELIHELEKEFPLDKAEKWDNSGLQIGRRNKEVKKVYIALDATDEVISEAVRWEADLLLTHHPMTLEGIKNVTTDSLTGRKIMTLIRHDISHYAMHTNYDVVEMGPAAGKIIKLQQPEILEVTGLNEKTGQPEGIGMVGSLVRPVSVEECANIVKRLFGLRSVKVFGDAEQIIERVAISPGSGKSMIGAALKAKAQVLITGDIGHHEGIDAVDQGMAIIDAGHYGLEHIFIENMKKYLSAHMKDLEVKTAELRNPFQII